MADNFNVFFVKNIEIPKPSILLDGLAVLAFGYAEPTNTLNTNHIVIIDLNDNLFFSPLAIGGGFTRIEIVVDETFPFFFEPVDNTTFLEIDSSITPAYIQDVDTTLQVLDGNELLGIAQPEILDGKEKEEPEIQGEKSNRLRHKKHSTSRQEKSQGFLTHIEPIGGKEDEFFLFLQQKIIDLNIEQPKISFPISASIEFALFDDFELDIPCQIIEHDLTFLPIQDIFDINTIQTPEQILWVDSEIYTRVRVLEISPSSFIIWYAQMHIDGMDYGGRYWSTDGKSFDLNRPTLIRKHHKQRSHSFFKSIKENTQNNDLLEEPSNWDLLFALLQPTLNLEATDMATLPSKLYPYQPTGVISLAQNQHFLLADDMGTGKTIMTIVAMKVLMQKAKIRHALILCLRSVLSQWEEQLHKWAPELKTTLVRDIQKETRRIRWKIHQHVYITTYDTLTEDVRNGILEQDRLGYFDLLVMDEAHHIKNSDTQRHRTLKKLNARWRWALTGTPIQNKIGDLRSIFDVIYPECFDNQKEYTEAQVKEQIKPYFLRRLKRDVLKDLPPKTHQDFLLEMDDEQIAAYDAVLTTIKNDYGIIKSQADSMQRTYIIGKLITLKGICNFAPGSLKSPKERLLRDQIDEIIRSKNKVLVFSQFKEEGVTKLAKILSHYGIATIVGGQNDGTRKQEIDKFKTRDEISILLATIQSGGEGLNLAEASYVIHFDHWWNPAVLSQAEDRAHRAGQTQGVNVYSYWMSGTIDEKIRLMLDSKRQISEKVIDGLADKSIEQTLKLSELWKIFGV